MRVIRVTQNIKTSDIRDKAEMWTSRMSSNEIFISIHALDKYLDIRNVHPSAFFDQHMMYENIGKCLSQCGIMIVRSMIWPWIKS